MMNARSISSLEFIIHFLLMLRYKATYFRRYLLRLRACYGESTKKQNKTKQKQNVFVTSISGVPTCWDIEA